MSIQVYKLAEIIDGEVVLSGARRFRQGEISALLANLLSPSDADPQSAWTFALTIGEGIGARKVRVDLPPLLPKSYSGDSPFVITTDNIKSDNIPLIVYFRNRLFLSERPAMKEAERAEVMLRVKKLFYAEETELSRLRAAVANIEAAVEFQKSGSRRDPIPEDVKLLVWTRDGGRCVICGSKEELHFDHIIPVAKGGGNLAENIQILCQPCNLRKSDKIAMP
jgi:hypothetical protein